MSVLADRPLPARPEPPAGEGLRERKKRLMRQQLSDTATQMFLDRGFDAVRVAEIAEACGVSEPTVFNYFPTKEALILDRLGTAEAALRTALADPGVSPLQAVLTVLEQELAALTSWLAAQDDLHAAVDRLRRFAELIHSTPALRAYQRDTAGRLATTVAQALAERTGLDSTAPEPQIAATALLGLWPIQFQSLQRHLGHTTTPAHIHQAVTDDVHRAAALIDNGLHTFLVSKP
jgi:AcrR family transcriptional regulator